MQPGFTQKDIEIAKLKIEQFPLLISNIDAVLKTIANPILEL